MRALEVEKIVEIPEGIEVKVDGRVVTITGEKGTLTRDFSHAPLSIHKEENQLRIRDS